MIDDVVVEELHVTGLESRREGELFGQSHEQLDRFVLGRAQGRHSRDHLGDLDVGEGVVTRELAVAHTEDGQGVHDVGVVRLLPEATAVDVSVEDGGQIRAPGEHLRWGCPVGPLALGADAVNA